MLKKYTFELKIATLIIAQGIMKTKYVFHLFFLILLLNAFPGFNGTIDKRNLTNFPLEGTRVSGDVELKLGRSTFLYGTKATHFAGELKKQGGDYFTWKGNAELSWAVSVPKVEKYDLYLIADIPGDSKNIEFA